jgi:type I restriction enzyme S subunit
MTAVLNTTVQATLNLSDLKRLPIPVPPKREREAIAEVLGALDDKIAANDRRASLMSDLAASIYTSVRQRAHRRFALAELVTTQYGVTTSAVNGPGPRLLRVTDINKNPWIEWDTAPACQVNLIELEKYRLRDGDILVARMADPGKAALVDAEDPTAVFASYLVRLSAHLPQHAQYIFYFLRSDEYQRYADGAASGSVQRNMNAKIIVGTEVYLPSEDALTRFNARISDLRRSLSAVLRESHALARTRDELLPLLMSGRVRVRDAARAVDEVAL